MYRQDIQPAYIVVFLSLLAVVSCQISTMLNYDARCILNDSRFPCTAAQWTQGREKKDQLHITGSMQFIRIADSCLASLASTGPANIETSVAVVRRGGCSFGTKALVAQQLGFGALIIVDMSCSEERPPPPGLGADSPSIGIPVVMVSAQWVKHSNIVDENGELSCVGSACTVSLSLSVPDEKSLWESSPWYGKSNAPLSATAVGTRRYSYVCDPTSPLVQRLGDDGWLFKRWLEELANETKGYGEVEIADGNDGNVVAREISKPKGCFEIGSIRNQVNLSAEETFTHIPDGLFGSSDSDEHGFGLVRLPHFDAAEEAMEDLEILVGEEEDEDANSQQRSLRGLNSNSHHFPWGGHNKYPRVFQSGVLVVRRGSVRLDGVILAHSVGDGGGGGGSGSSGDDADDGYTGSSSSSGDAAASWPLSARPVAEFHYGGCGCCPLGHGEIGKTFERGGGGGGAEEAVTVHHEKKLITLVQRFHHVYYHVVLEVLPRLLQVLDVLLLDRSWRVLVDVSGGAFVKEYLEQVLGLEANQILPFDPHVKVFADLLLVPAPLPCGHVPKALIQHFHSYLGAWMARQPFSPKPPYLGQPAVAYSGDGLSSEVHTEAPDTNIIATDETCDWDCTGDDDPTCVRCQPRRKRRRRVVLVLKRLGTRSVENHHQLVEALREGLSADVGDGSFEIRELEASGLSVSEQAAAFSSADVLVAPHGSGLTNTFFMAAAGTGRGQREFGGSTSRGNQTTPGTRGDCTSTCVSAVGSGLQSEDSTQGHFPVVVELLPWEYPNLTFYVALGWLKREHGGPGLRHVVFLVSGANAYGPMKVDTRSFVKRLKRYLKRGSG